MTHGNRAIIPLFNAGQEEIAGAGSGLRRRRQAGFSLLELLVALAIIAIAAGFATMGIGSFVPAMRANQSMYRVVESLRQARMLAMSQNRGVSVQLTADNSIVVEILDIDDIYEAEEDDWKPVRDVAPAAYDPSGRLEKGHRFITWNGSSGVSTGTSSNYNGPDATDTFETQERYVFTPDGFLTTFTDLDTPRGGTIFIGPPAGGVDSENLRLTRAVTILGATGRIDGWKLTNGAWSRVR